MSYFARLIEQSQLNIDRAPLAATPLVEFETGQQTDIVEIDTYVEPVAPPPLPSPTVLITAAPARAAEVEPTDQVALSPNPEIHRPEQVTAEVPSEVTADPPAVHAEQRPISREERADGEVVVQRVLAWVRAGAESDDAEDDFEAIKPVNPVESRPVSLAAARTMRSGELHESEDHELAFAPVQPAHRRARELARAEVEPPLRQAFDSMPTSDDAYRAPVEEIFEVSIGSINVRLEAPTHTGEREPRSAPVQAPVQRQAPPPPTRLSRNYLHL